MLSPVVQGSQSFGLSGYRCVRVRVFVVPYILDPSLHLSVYAVNSGGFYYLHKPSAVFAWFNFIAQRVRSFLSPVNLNTREIVAFYPG